MKTLKFVVLFYLLMPSLSIDAQFTQQGPKLVNAAFAVDGLQGYSVDISADGNTAIVGVPRDGITGGAIIYVRKNGEWKPDGQKLAGSDYKIGSFTGLSQGTSVAISGDGTTIAIGDPNDNDYLGAVYIFVKTNGKWLQQGTKLSASGLTSVSGQGNSVDLSYDGHTLVFGAPLIYIGNAAYKGGVFVYKRSGTNWVQQGSRLYSGDTRNVPTNEGYAVSVSGDGTKIVAGAPGRYDNYFDGEVYFYAFINGVWQATNGFEGDGNLGVSVSLNYDGSVAVVGAPTLTSRKGGVLIFTYRGIWENTTTISDNNITGKNNQGESVAISSDGNRVVFGGGGNYSLDVSGLGQVWCYTKLGNSWVDDGMKYQGTGAVGSARQGIAIALSADGKDFIVGGAYDDDKKGAAWVFSENKGGTSSIYGYDEEDNIVIFPNPVSEAITIQPLVSFEKPCEINIKDQLGRVVLSFIIEGENTSHTQPIANLPEGLYYICYNKYSGAESRIKFLKID